MSDNLNKSIQDKGWAEMSALLDKEMPQEKKKRRAILWFYFVGAAAIGFVVVATMFTQGNDMEMGITNNQESVSESIKEKNDLKSNEVVLNTAQEIEGEIDQKRKESTNEEERIDKEEKRLNLSNTPIISNQNIDITNRNIDPVLEKNTENVVEEKKVIARLNSDISTEDFTSNLNDETLTDVTGGVEDGIIAAREEADDVAFASMDEVNQEKYPEKSFITPLQSLPLRDLDMLDFTQKNNLMITPVNIKPLKMEYAFSPYAMATGLYQSNQGALGHGLGVGLDYGNSDFSIYSEIAYIRSNYEEESGNDSRILADGSFEIVTGDQESFPMSSTSNIPVELDNFTSVTKRTNEIRFDIGVRKSIFKNFGLVGGVAISRLTRIENREFNFALDEETMDNDLVSGYAITKNDLQEAGVFSQYDIIPHLGLEWNITNRFFLGLDYNYGLINLISETDLESFSSSVEDESIYRRNFALKLRYAF